MGKKKGKQQQNQEPNDPKSGGEVGEKNNGKKKGKQQQNQEPNDPKSGGGVGEKNNGQTQKVGPNQQTQAALSSQRQEDGSGRQQQGPSSVQRHQQQQPGSDAGSDPWQQGGSHRQQQGHQQRQPGSDAGPNAWQQVGSGRQQRQAWSNAGSSAWQQGGSGRQQQSDQQQQRMSDAGSSTWQQGGSGRQQQAPSSVQRHQQQQPGSDAGSGPWQQGGSHRQQQGHQQRQPGSDAGSSEWQQGGSGRQQGHQQRQPGSNSGSSAWQQGGSGRQQQSDQQQQRMSDAGSSTWQQGGSGRQQQAPSSVQRHQQQQPGSDAGSGPWQQSGSHRQQQGHQQRQPGSDAGSSEWQQGGSGRQQGHQQRQPGSNAGSSAWQQGGSGRQQQSHQQQQRMSDAGSSAWQQGGSGRQQQGPSSVQRHQQDKRSEQRQHQQQVESNRNPTAIMPVSNIERGTIGKPFHVETNYLILNLDKMPDVAYHYDVKIELYNSDPKKIKTPPKKFLRHAFEAYAKKVLPGYKLAYDGKASAYSADKLPEDIIKANEGVLIEAQVDQKDDQENKEEEPRPVQFLVTLKSTADMEIDLTLLKTYQKDRIFDKPMRPLQCIEVVLRTPCHEKGVRGGSSYYPKPDQPVDLGDGYELWYGLYQAAMLCDIPLLNVDVSHKSFPSQVNLVEFYNDRRCSSEALREFLKGLTVVYHPPPCFKATSKRYKFNAVLRSSNKEMLNLDGKKMTVEKYFLDKGYKLQFPDCPCLHVGSTVKNIFIPLELITVPAGQAILRKDNDNQIRNMIRRAATSTPERKQKIMDLLKQFQYYAHPVVERFGISVGNNFIKIEARLLNPPNIEYRSNKVINLFPGEWRAQDVNFYNNGNASTPCKWAVVNCADKMSILKLSESFVNMISSAASKMGMNLEKTCSKIQNCFVDSRDRNSNKIRTELFNLKKINIGLVFVILPWGRNEHYSKVKQIAEIEYGVVTQCIKYETINKFNPMTANNILLKVNAKINGINHKIADKSTIKLQKDGKVMFVGADVSHPSPLQKDIPSIVGVVASHDPYGTQYNMQYRLQDPGVETIKDMEEIFKEHLRRYKTHRGEYPNTVIYYRDGVSDGQFKQIENIELKAMRQACTALKCEAKFTCIIVVKRHHTRFFPFREDAEGKFMNVKAGTVVDRTIIHPGEKQFFMVSHKSIQGTARPTRYNVIVDDSKISINDLQTLTYNLCHLFPRCNRSVSYPAPAYLSHLVGLRGRAYIQGSPINLENLNDENKNRRICDDMKKNPMHFV